MDRSRNISLQDMENQAKFRAFLTVENVLYVFPHDRLRELDVLEKIAGNSKRNVVLGEKGLAERIVNLI